jgi:NTE family protein
MNFYNKYILFFILSIFNSFSYAQIQDSVKVQDSVRVRPKVGLVLSGGGAKGFAHVEVIEAIEKAGIKIDYISGTSMGAIVGSLYAAGYSPAEIKKAVENIDFVELFLQEKNRNFIPFFDKSYREKYILTLPFNDFKFSLPSALSKGQGPLMLLTYLLNDVREIDDYSKLPIPFFCIATNLATGEEEQLESGFLPLSVLASAAYPSLIEPVKIGDKIMIDGGIVNNFPAKALRNKGMDIIIGVDLGAGLQKSEDINSIFNILSQIMSFRINIKTDFERSYVDLLIKPNLKNYKVPDFDKKDSILSIGRIAARKAFPALVEIAKAQGYDTINRPRMETSPSEKHVFITKFDVIGNLTNDITYIKRKMGVSVPQNTSIEKLNMGVSALYSTGNFNQVYYEIKDDPAKESQQVILYLDEKNNNSLKFGIHYDDIYKASLLANVTLNKLFLKNSTLSIDVVFGNNFRSYLNYFIDNGVYPSIGFNASFNSFNFNYSDVKKNEYVFNRLRNYNQQIYIQSTISEKYAIGAGMEYSYTSISPFLSNTYIKNVDFSKDESFFYNPYFYIRADTRDNAHFPSRGFKLDAVAKSFLFSNAPDFEKFSMVMGDLSYSIPISKRLSIESLGSLGISFDNPSLQQKYFLGGYFEQDLLHFKRFLGLPFNYISGNQLISLYASLNYRVLKNHYLKAYANFANIEEKFEDIKYFKYDYSGYGVGYGYDSPFGPINLMYTYSVDQNKGIFNVGLGYWF